MNKLTKDGLTGNSGLGVGNFYHVTANYAAGEGNCFVRREDSEYGETWERISTKQALIEKLTIIPCNKCANPAISLDHHWPCMSDYNYCEAHRPSLQNGECKCNKSGSNKTPEKLSQVIEALKKT